MEARMGPRCASVKEAVRVALGFMALAILVTGVPPNLLEEPAFAQDQQRGTLDRPLFMAERFNVGQSIHPVFEGWEPNPNGTFSLYFGYMNRNWKEEVDVPIGPENSFSPGPQDRGQPTHFVPRRAKNAFRVIVPEDFGEQTLVWTLAFRGETNQVPGSIRNEYQIDVLLDRETGNTPPEITAIPHQTVELGTPLSLTVEVNDDGLPKIRERRRAPRRVQRGPRAPLTEPELRGLALYWRKYRGPGDVTFAPAAKNIVDGKATTTVNFASVGDYVLQLLADDGTGHGGIGMDHCCWSTSEVEVTVRAR